MATMPISLRMFVLWQNWRARLDFSCYVGVRKGYAALAIPEVPTWLCDIIARLHAKKPEDRFATALDVAKLLAQSRSPSSPAENPPETFAVAKTATEHQTEADLAVFTKPAPRPGWLPPGLEQTRTELVCRMVLLA